MIRRGPGIVQNRAVQEAVVWFYKNVLLKRLERGTSPEKRGLMRALVHLRRAVAAYPGDAHLWLQRGIVAFQEDELPEALAVYGDAARISDPELRKAVARGRRRPYRSKEKGTILVDLQFPGTFQY